MVYGVLGHFLRCSTKWLNSMNKRIVVGISISLIVIVLIILISGILIFRAVMNSGITAGPDQMFGDQHLKTSVALIELHKTRYGKYPASLNELKFIGQ